MYDFASLSHLIENSQKSITIFEQSINNLFDWQRPSIHVPNGFLISKIREALFQKNHKHLLYKENFSDKIYSKISFLTEEYELLIPNYIAAIRGVNKAKKDDILKSLVPIMPENNREFWLNLETNEVPDLCNQENF